MKFIVKLSPEITIKTRPVRKRFVTRLHANIRKICRLRELSADVVLRWDMLELQLERLQEEDEAMFVERCSCVAILLAETPGIAHFLEVTERPLALEGQSAEQALAYIAEQTFAIFGEQLADKTFAVRCKRGGRHSFTSHEVERAVGAYLNQNSAASGVNLKQPDITVPLEIKDDRLFIVRRRVKGLGGYPLGCVGPVLSLISGGYDSSVASFDTIRRGMETHFCFFNLGGSAHEIGVKQVSHYLWERYAASHRTAFISVAFEQVVEEILHKISNPYMGVVLKRMMMRAASSIAGHMNIPALVTGESIAQVSSQTIQNLAVIDQVTDILTIRPLITCDKNEIIAKAAATGVATYAEHMPEYCAVISDKPSTAAKLDAILQEEKKFDFAILEQAIEQRRACAVDAVYEKDVVFDDIEQQAIPSPGQIVIDLRHDDERDKQPLVLHANQTLSIPFYKINKLFGELDPAQQYLLYCDRGVMSKLHAAHLRAAGYSNVKVFRPD